MTKTNIKPFYPPWAKPGCTVLHTWDEGITSGDAVGNARYCRYTTAKGDVQETMMWVKWEK